MNNTIVSIVAERINKIIEEEKTLPWLKTWRTTSFLALNYETRKEYSLLNQVMLGAPGEYLTFKQIQARKGHIKKGSKAKHVIFWKLYKKDMQITTENSEAINEYLPVLRYYNVFSLEDVEGIESKLEKPDTNTNIKTNEDIEKVITDYTTREKILVKREEVSNRAYYNYAEDFIRIPKKEQFDDIAEYYSMLFHELTHSTGHSSRLNRKFGASMKDVKYSREELVAEIGAATILNRLGIETPATIRNNAAYIKSWSEALTKAPEEFILACGRAEKAVKLILNIKDEPTQEQAEQ